MAQLDGIDKKILYALAQDSRQTIERIAEQVNLSQTPVRRRIKRMENEGFIRGYTLDVDMKRAGYALTLFVFVKLQSRTRETIADFEARILTLREVTHCALVTGAYDYILTLRTKDMDSYNGFLRTVLAELPGVFGIESNVIIGEVKNQPPLPH